MAAGGIKQQTLSAKIGQIPGRAINGGLRASGTPIRNPGRIAGGAIGVANSQFQQTLAPIVYRSPTGTRPGGLIDRRQQIDPSGTDYIHPFSGGRYLSTSSHALLHQTGAGMGVNQWNGFTVHQGDTPKNQPHERPSFFMQGKQPLVRTVFGTNQSGPAPAPDTAFNRQPRVWLPRPAVQSTPEGTRISRTYNPPSFGSFNRLVYDPNNSSYGFGGRWGQVKRSANQTLQPGMVAGSSQTGQSHGSLKSQAQHERLSHRS